MNARHVKDLLADLAEEGVPAAVDLWPALRTRAAKTRPAATRPPLRAAQRLAWSALALLVLLAFGGAAYALGPAVVSRLFQLEGGLSQVDEANLAQTLDLSQTVDGVTVALERAYADANRIVVAFTIRGAEGQRYEPREMELTDAAGNQYWVTSGVGVAGESAIAGLSLPPGEGSYVFSFDASTVQGAPETLDLRLTLGVDGFELPAESTMATPMPTVPPPGMDAPTVAEAQPVPQGRSTGPFTFDFSVPFVAGRSVEVEQTVEAGGMAMTLQRVVVTPSETRAVLCFTAPGGAGSAWTMDVTLTPARGEILSPGIFDLKDSDGDGCRRISFLTSLYDRQGEWTLTVAELAEMQYTERASAERVVGPWVFHFQAP